MRKMHIQRRDYLERREPSRVQNDWTLIAKERSRIETEHDTGPYDLITRVILWLCMLGLFGVMFYVVHGSR